MTILRTFKPSPRFTLSTPEQEDAIESAGLLLIAADHLRDQARDALLTTPATRESYSRRGFVLSTHAQRQPMDRYDVTVPCTARGR